MKFLVDENCSAILVEQLRDAGFDVEFVVETSPGISDAQVLARALSGGRVLITEDTDFGELTMRHGANSRGIVLMRIAIANRPQIWPRLKAAIDQLGERLEGAYTVVQIDKTRHRPLPNPMWRDGR